MTTSDKIRSVNDLIESLKDTDFNDEKCIYRGQANSNWNIQPLLLIQNYSDEPYVLEKTLFLPLFQDKVIPFLTSKDPIEYLMILQHYGVPTRLLDWTKDILVALFFACYDKNNENFQEDGVFIVSHRSHFETISLRVNESIFNVNDFSVVDKKKFWERIETSDINYIEPLFLNPRQRIQNGCFLFFPFKTINESDVSYVILDDYISYKNNFLRNNGLNGELYLAKKKIDKNYKKAILRELDQMYSITYDNLMISSGFSNEMDLSFKLFFQNVQNDFPRIRDIYDRRK